MKTMVSLSRKKKKGRSAAANDRSLMLKEVMPLISSDRGERIAKAIKALDDGAVEKEFQQIGKILGDRLRAKKEKMGAK